MALWKRQMLRVGDVNLSHNYRADSVELKRRCLVETNDENNGAAGRYNLLDIYAVPCEE